MGYEGLVMLAMEIKELNVGGLWVWLRVWSGGVLSNVGGLLV